MFSCIMRQRVLQLLHNVFISCISFFSLTIISFKKNSHSVEMMHGVF